MLELIRNRIASVFVKILFAVLVLSFVVWGIADVFRPGRSKPWAAEVGSRTITVPALQEQYRQTVRRVGESIGKPLDAEQARAMGLPGTVLNRMIEGTLIDLAAADLGISVGDDALREGIRADARFHNQSNQFDPTFFREILRRNGLTEQQYVELLRRDTERQQVVNSLVGGAVAPKALTDLIARYSGERRTADYVEIAEANTGPLPAPDDATLRKFYQDYPGLFTAPEYRSATAVILSADEVAKGVVLAPQEVQAAYQERLGEFTTPERRSFRQSVFSDEATARRVRERVANGADLAAAAREENGPGSVPSPIGPVSREQLPADLAAVFSLPTGQVSEPLKSPLGWHLVEVTAIETGSVQPFDQVKDRLTADLKREKAADMLVDLGNRLEDALGRGAAVEEAARDLGLPTRKIEALDSGGRDASGAEVSGLPERLVETIFETPANADSALVEADRDSYFVVHVDSVSPSALRPYETVRAQVEESWRDRQRNERARQAADEIAQQVRSGRTLAAVAAERKLKVAAATPFNRSGEGAAELPRPMVSALFDAKVGEVVVVPAPDGFAVAQLSAVLPPAEGGAEAEAEARVRAELASSIRNDLLEQFSQGLRERYPVRVNSSALEAL